MESNKNQDLILALSGLTVLVYLVALAILGSDLPSHYGFPLDDSWIHQSVGRNLAHFGSLGYLPHERSSGSTSLLWTLILSGNYVLVPALNPVLFTAVINCTLTCVIGVLLLRLALRDGMPTYLAVIVAAAPALDGNYLWLAFTGMEHLLFIALSLASIWFWLAPSKQANEASWRSTLAAGVCMGLLGMTRPEGAVLPLLLLIGTSLFAAYRTRSRVQVLTAALIFVAVGCIPFVVNLYTSHSLLPATFQGRKWLLFSDSGSYPTVLGRLAEQWSARPFKAVAAFDGVVLDRMGQILMFGILAILAVLTVMGVRALIRGRRRLLLVLCGWSLLHALMYAFILPGTGHGGRYQPFILLLMLPLFALGLHELLGRLRFAAKALPAALLLTVGCFSLPIWRAALVDGIDHINRTHGVIAAWLAQNLPGEKVAVFDIGRIGYERGARGGDPNIIDLGGLTDPAYINYLFQRKVPAYLAEHDIHYIVLPANLDGASGIGRDLRLSRNPEVATNIVFRVCSPSADWQLSWSEFRNATQCQEVDSVSFSDVDADRKVGQAPRPELQARETW